MEGLHLLADVAVADFEDCGDSPKKKKQGPRFRERNCCALDQDASKFIHLNMLVDESKLKLCFEKTNNNSIVSSTQTPKPSSSHPLHLLSQIAFAYRTSTLWALCANSIPTKSRSTSNRRFKHGPAPAIAGTKRRYDDINTSHKEVVEEEEIQTQNSHKRRETRSLPIQLSNYLTTKKGVSDPKLVIIKQLYGTDLNPQHCRFSIPVNLCDLHPTVP
ncbi:hypothetical protein H0E87_007854 [Populus deltoides]|uniref:Uncharacterized protein n=1 Tax=Populus deltoides TaxID=3696 RepID=A0A8T2YYJ0_POPDE|nr:hypothetical protein H0E87_007854 [Populus deltoides]